MSATDFSVRLLAHPVAAHSGGRGYTVREVASRLRVGEDKIRGWIRKGELAAVNTASAACGRPRWIVTAESLASFEKRRAGGPATKPAPRRRRAKELQDFYPERSAA